MLPDHFPTPEDMSHLRWEAEPNCYRPDYARALSTVFPTIYSLLGHPPDDRPNMAELLPAAVPRRVKRVFVLCVDSMGFKEMAYSPWFSEHYKAFGTWVSSVFPSITSCALSSLYQGLPPARHGILGHLVWKDFPGGVVDMLKMQVVGARSSLVQSGFQVNQWKREPGLLETPLSAEVPGMNLMPFPIVRSGLSTYSYGNTRMVGFAQPVEGFTKASQILQDIDHGWVGLYLDMVDSLSHVITHDAPQFGITVRFIEDCVRWLASSLPADVAEETLFLMIADHGQDVIQEMLTLDGEHGEWLRSHTRGLGFSGRVMHVYLNGAANGRAVKDGLTSLMGDRGRIYDFADAAPLVGAAPDDAWARQTLGDQVAILHEGFCWENLEFGRPRGPYDTRLLSQHGGMTWDEMFVPMLTAPMSELAATARD
jgi:hypothetical protein